MMKFVRSLGLCAAPVVFTASTAFSEDIDAVFSGLETRWQGAIDHLRVPGMSVAVVYNDNLVYAKGFGVRRVDPALPFTPDTACYIASSTKPFTAAGIMTLVDQGKIDLDAPVKTYLPRFDLPDHDLANTITVRDLLCHRYGIDNSILTFAEAYTGLWNDDFFFTELPKSSGVLGSWQYTNLHFTIAGRIIESVTGQPWQEYLRDAIFRPLGMKHTTARASELYAFDDVALGLIPGDDAWHVSSVIKVDKTMHAAGGIGASARDLAQWLRLNMSDGSVDGARIVSEASLAEMLKPIVDTSGDFFLFDRGKMGLAWHLGGYRGELLVHHFGGYVGYAAHVSFMPEHELGVVALTNSDRIASLLIHQVAADVYDRVLGLAGEDLMPDLFERDREIRERRAANPVPPLPGGPLTLSRPLDAYTGTFESDRWGTLVIKRSGDTLIGSIGNLNLTFHAGEEDKLFMSWPLGRETAAFVVDATGRVNEVRIASYGIYTMRFTRT